MRFRFKSRKLRSLYTEERGAHKYPPGVVDAFFEAIEAIGAAADERDLRALKGFRYKKLKGGRKGTYSLRLNDQFRLIIQQESDQDGKYVLVVDIDPH